MTDGSSTAPRRSAESSPTWLDLVFALAELAAFLIGAAAIPSA